MRGLLILGLLGEKLARLAITEGLDGDVAFQWLEMWNSVCLDAERRRLISCDQVAADLHYQLISLRHAVAVAEGESDG